MVKRRPYLGIAARTFRSRRFGEQTSYLRGIVKLAAGKGMRGYVFSAGDVDWVKGRIHGWSPGPNGWRRGWFPLPDVVYDRAWGLDERGRLAHAQTLERLERYRHPPLQPGLRRQDRCVPSSPRVGDRRRPSSRDASSDRRKPQDLGARYSTLYIKPSRGRQGKGIRKCRRLKEGWSLMKTAAKGRVSGHSRRRGDRRRMRPG